MYYDEADKVIVYGIGEYFNEIHDHIFNKIKVDYLCDQSFTSNNGIFHGIRTITREEMINTPDICVLVCIKNRKINREVIRDLLNKNINAYDISVLLQGHREISAEELKEFYPNGYSDFDGNRIVLKGNNIPNGFVVHFCGNDGLLEIGDNIEFRGVVIAIGTNGACYIGSDTVINSTYDIVATEGKIEIGKKCIFGANVVVRNCNGHHIFDKRTGDRICAPKDVHVGDHVWIGREVMLWGGAYIGDGCMVGARTITSDKFDSNMLIAGTPGRVFRRDIVWSRDSEMKYNWNYVYECNDKEGLLY